MKILQVMAGAEHGGAETAFVDMCLALHESKQTMMAVTRPNELRVSQLSSAGIPVRCLPFGGAIDCYTPWMMRRIIQKFQPDIVQTWMARAPQKTPRWDRSMTCKPYSVVARLGGYYKLKYFKSADFFTTITPDIRSYLIQEGISEAHVRHINNFAETELSLEKIQRSDYGVPDDAKLLLGLGRLHPSKAFDTLIKAVAGLEGVYLWIAGEGPQRRDLEQLIVQLGLQDRVRLLGWRSDRASLFQACDICVFSSRYEPFGTVFVQAWAQKVPLVTTNSDGPRQFVRDGVDGLVVSIDDIEGMQKAISTMITDKELSVRLVEKGYARYLNEFTKDKTVESYLGFYKEILSGHFTGADDKFSA